MISQIIQVLYLIFVLLDLLPPYTSGKIPDIANIRSSLNDQISNKANNSSSLIWRAVLDKRVTHQIPNKANDYTISLND
ncbi:hypothetical protein RhiirA1_422293 [Rhizophagus irregularis]|uniref:Uncharacterized protein n=2 Tax=Rhizophagus irregularis TaxID=588596 RepID=U9T8R3_RHIID|nr:hypothetical protein GLOIN_2v1734254 [Rhizophagus irregularis DAOM 181602=DAOM 197198]PKC63822.1 hypothetical protein RhiirA1_422293 [Rhizophagus irregularis]POG58026.1 hypothetical protein GLOIN_2v1734254 [Rhizophagus irregularis DAOM 181602=DAOM 197198]UZO00469.1 hypothetical protein OCT59_011602 [Rhizophagus irregularis]CAB4474808.1 unnamed protein product [Rhizophagus irregularis]GBC39144.1 hypothetical protein GLOIN_2v1734254 [Rhizophagus irregularis DAOM 181602=DAOM 197198]|eukprot:XP_025164892.1 hypothetical protein GLOIN_2v1734254 [Rhizophagus irregularis DAOM 181602=DAOM 197198]